MNKVWKFHNDVDTDQIIASQYLLLPDIEAMKQYTFESLDPDFSKKVQPGDLIVAGENFGCGSSREQAPSVLKALGIKAVIAKSFARIFYRNSINIGLPVIVCKELYDHVEDGGEADLDLSAGTVTVNGQVFSCTKLPEYMQNILNAGGLIASLNKEEAKIMGMTLGEKIIARAAGVDFVKPNDIHTVTLDRMMSNDGTTHLTVDMYYNQLKHPQIADKDKVVFIMDHNVPAENPKTAEAHKKMRDFAIENDIKLYEGQGVCHQIMMEDYVCPGELIFGADSHTTSYGALGAFGTGVGCTDFLYAMTTGTSWVMVPETIRFNLHGELKEGAYPRDLILTIIGDIGANGANYKIMEFAGDGAHKLSVDDRMVLCNLTVEAGAKAGIVEPDEKVVEYCKAHGREAVHMFKSDEDAHFCEVYDYDLSKIEPVVVRPDFVDNFALLKDVKEERIAIDEAFLGSCNNGRIDDLRVAAEIVKGKQVDPKVRFIVAPASKAVYIQALEEGIITTLMEAGAMVMNCNCSVCWGSCQGVIGENEVLISTGTRNFKGRAGAPSSKVYLASAATVAASALAGYITEPEA